MIALLYVLITTHLTAAIISIYFHRSLAHNAVKYNAAVEHVFRFYLWLTFGIERATYIGVHRLHHATSDTEQDFTSPHYEKNKLYTRLAWQIGKQATDSQRAYLQKFVGRFEPDWLDRNVYCYTKLGFVLLFVLNFAIWSYWAIAITAAQLLWIVVFNMVTLGLCHSGAARSHESDRSQNLYPWAVFFGGEELHYNHHHSLASANFAHRQRELDIGYTYICALRYLRLAT